MERNIRAARPEAPESSTQKRKAARTRSVSPPSLEETAAAAAAVSTAGNDPQTKKPAPKRARKVVNCPPCRANKLKCDRNRPCSSCVLRGTISQCYQDSDRPDAGSASIADPLAELGKIRKALSSIEQYVRSSSDGSALDVIDEHGSETLTAPGSATGLRDYRPLSSASNEELNGAIGPGSRGRQTAGLYTGPTSTAAHLIIPDAEEFDQTPVPSSTLNPGESDVDILRQMPDARLVELLIDYYFLHCQWIYRHVWEGAFRPQWAEYRAGRSTDRVVLATCCAILALTTVYMPDEHPLELAATQKLGPRPNEKLFTLMQTVLCRFDSGRGSGSYTLEFAELLLIRGHYLLYATQDAEVIWSAKSRMITVATAMGLHRDPSQWRMPIEVAERRRWLWWTILSYERWQSFILGRPPSIADHHFDTQFPRRTPDLLYDPMTCTAALQMFGLADIIGGVTDDALSLRPVPYSNVRHHDQKLEQWFTNIPQQWNLSDEDVRRGLASNDLPTRRLTVQAISIMAAYYHIRFTLHRPYAARSTSPVATPSPQPGTPQGLSTAEEMRRETAESTEIAIANADHVMRISLLCACDASTPPERVFATRGLLAFHSFRLFSVAMFYSFQLIATPFAPHAWRFRDNITRILVALQATPLSIPGGRVAANAAKIMDALAPLWSDRFVHMQSGPDKEVYRRRVLAHVRTLAFPYHDLQDSGGTGVSVALQDVSATLQSIYTANPTVMTQDPNPNTVPQNTGQAQFHAASFGSRGSLMPDMSVSGRTSIGNPVDFTNQFSNPNGGNYVTLNLDNANVFGNNWTQPGLTGVLPQGVAYDNQPYSSEMTNSQPMAQGTSSSYWVQDQANGWQLNGPAAQPQQALLSPSSVQNAYAPGAHAHHPQSRSQSVRVDQMQRHPIGPISPGMSWGASIGIDAGEWAGVAQAMEQDAPEMLQSDVPDGHQPAYGY